MRNVRGRWDLPRRYVGMKPPECGIFKIKRPRRADRVRRRYCPVIMIELTVPVKSRMKMMYSHKSFEETPNVGYSRLNGLVGRTVSADGIARKLN